MDRRRAVKDFFMSKTVVGLFSTLSEAENVKQTLSTQGIDAQHITVVANDADDDLDTSSHVGEGDKAKGGIGHKISSFFSNLMGGDHDAHEHYASGVNSGGGLVAVTVPDEKAESVAMLLKQHGARDIEGGYEDAADAGVPVYGGAAATSGGTTIPIVEEELLVGKREVERGGVRVYSHVVDVPVSADVTLRDERINVTRHAVSRPATAADFSAGQGSVVELTATGEEAVVGKSARVVEEVLVGKDSTQHTEAIHDTVRKTEVEVEEVPAETAGARY